MKPSRILSFKPSALCSKGTHVVERDLRTLRHLVDKFGGELGQWRASLELSPTACAILAVLLICRGLRPGPDGCGVQIPIRMWCRILGRRERQVQQSFEALADASLVKRYANTAPVRLLSLGRADTFVDSEGYERSNANVHAVTYLTAQGVAALRWRGEIRQLVAGKGRQLVQGGLVGFLLRVTARDLRAAARRVAAVVEDCTPKKKSLPEERNDRPRAVGLVNKSSASVPPAVALGKRTADELPAARGRERLAVPRTSSEHDDRRARTHEGDQRSAERLRGRGAHRAAAATFHGELERCWRERAFTPALAYPERWKSAGRPGRAAIEAEFSAIRRALTRRLLEQEIDDAG